MSNPPAQQISLYRRLRHRAKQVGLRRVVDLVTRKEPWASDWHAIGFARDITLPFDPPNAKVPITVQPLTTDLANRMFDLAAPGISADERELRKSRGELWEAGFGNGYVAVTEAGAPAYCQWLIGPAHNRQIRDFFDGVFPELGPNDALLEAAFTPEAFRGLGIMPAAMARIAARGEAIGATRVVTFVTEDNIPSIKGCERSGFAPYIRRTVSWRGLRRTVTFTDPA